MLMQSNVPNTSKTPDVPPAPPPNTPKPPVNSDDCKMALGLTDC